jgi:hypothetical protein
MNIIYLGFVKSNPDPGRLAEVQNSNLQENTQHRGTELNEATAQIVINPFSNIITNIEEDFGSEGLMFTQTKERIKQTNMGNLENGPIKLNSFQHERKLFSFLKNQNA